MRKLEIADADVISISIQQEIQSSNQSRYRKPRPQVTQSDPRRVAALKKLRRLAPHNLCFNSPDELLVAVEVFFGQWRKPNLVL